MQHIMACLPTRPNIWKIQSEKFKMKILSISVKNLGLVN